MKDQRTAFLIGTLGNLVESLDATVRIAHWKGEEAVPEPLRAVASQLPSRLGSANRMATGKYVGTPVMVKTSAAICDAIRRLDGAFVAYRRSLDGSAAEKASGARALEAEVARIRSDASLGLSAQAS